MHSHLFFFTLFRLAWIHIFRWKKYSHSSFALKWFENWLKITDWMYGCSSFHQKKKIKVKRKLLEKEEKLCLRLLKMINATLENLRIAKHTSVRDIFRSPDWFVLCDLKILVGKFITSSNLTHDLFFYIQQFLALKNYTRLYQRKPLAYPCTSTCIHHNVMKLAHKTLHCYQCKFEGINFENRVKIRWAPNRTTHPRGPKPKSAMINSVSYCKVTAGAASSCQTVQDLEKAINFVLFLHKAPRHYVLVWPQLLASCDITQCIWPR